MGDQASVPYPNPAGPSDAHAASTGSRPSSSLHHGPRRRGKMAKDTLGVGYSVTEGWAKFRVCPEIDALLFG